MWNMGITMFVSGLTDEEVRKIREAIHKANSLEEVERLQKILQSGKIPGNELNTSKLHLKLCDMYDILHILCLGQRNGQPMDYQ